MADGAGRQQHEQDVDLAHGAVTRSMWTRVPRFLLAFIVGAIGAVIFVYFHLPLPWYLGALTACLIASVARLPVDEFERRLVRIDRSHHRAVRQ